MEEITTKTEVDLAPTFPVLTVNKVDGGALSYRTLQAMRNCVVSGVRRGIYKNLTVFDSKNTEWIITGLKPVDMAFRFFDYIDPTKRRLYDLYWSRVGVFSLDDLKVAVRDSVNLDGEYFSEIGLKAHFLDKVGSISDVISAFERNQEL